MTHPDDDDAVPGGARGGSHRGGLQEEQAFFEGDGADAAPTGFKQEIAERVRRAMGGRSQSAFARAIGVSQSTVSEVVRGEREPRPSMLVRIAEVTGLSAAWLLTGEAQDAGSEGAILVPHVDTGGEEPARPGVPFSAATLRELGIRPGRARVLAVRGEAADPVHAGGIAVIDLDATSVEGYGGLYAVEWPGGALVKRLERSFDGDLLIHGDGPGRGEATRLDAARSDRLVVLGRVRMIQRMV
ncbi:XRE family transcriptional regulator [Salinarimonas ramus]|uniref:HTH cro/C1-type domain-containing protein n=1 Tax=Salinarimonas ramus TaxID=690164 RepID=A0A917V5K1_9HYPH|nr:helix-turn-helix domain-containing protein [Salinarimonas ramus]GGK40891.1 hypothetical protein GCM10011322_30020 [Salinarimonas ramus]